MAPRTLDLRGSRAMPAADRWHAPGDVTILLPGERVFRGRDVRLRARGTGDEIEALEVLFGRATLPGAYRRASALAREWRLATRPLEAWYREALARGPRSCFDVWGPPLGPGGPRPAVSLLDSFDEPEPVLVELAFRW